MNREIGAAVDVLNKLVRESEDGQKGFSAASHVAKDGKLKALLDDYAQECGRAVGELQDAIRSLGAQPQDHGSISGAAHRGWLKIKSAIDDANAAVLDIVERGEDHAKSVYAEALKATLPSQIREMVARQREGVMRHYE